MTLFDIQTLLWISSYLISSSYAYFIMDNGKNIRIISLSSNCNKGRIEFYNGTIFGTLTDCNNKFELNHAKSICQSLGFEKEKEFWRGSINYDQNITQFNDPYIAYTQFNNCSYNLPNDDLCIDCLFQYDLKQCLVHSNDIHKDYDIFILCDNYGLNKKSSNYQCIQYEEYQSNQYSACHNIYLYDNDGNGNGDNLKSESSKKIIISIVAIAIFGSIFCVILFACYSKYNDSKRLSSSNNINYIDRNIGFSTVPTQGLELPTINNNNDDKYIPPPQPMFVYSTRSVIDNDQHNDMEEIIPSIIYSNNKSVSESYGLLKTDNDNQQDSQQNNQNGLQL